MIKFNGQEQIGVADRNAVGYEIAPVNKAEMDRALDAFLDGRGVKPPRWGANKASVKPPTPPAVDAQEQPRVRREKRRVAAPPPAPVATEVREVAPEAPTPAPVPVVETPPAAAKVDPQVELAEAALRLETAFYDYAFAKACCEHPAASPEVITDFAERLFGTLNLPAEIFQTEEGR